MDILLFTKNSGKAGYFYRKLKGTGHAVETVSSLASLHHALRFSDPDFVLVDSETFPEPDNDYRTIITASRRKFLLFYDFEIDSLDNSQIKDRTGKTSQTKRKAPEKTDICGLTLSEEQKVCISQIIDVQKDLQLHKTLTSGHFSAESPEGRQILKEHKLRLPHALILSCLLSNMGTDIAATTLLERLWADSGNSHIQTLYAYMNQIRILLTDRQIPLIIDKRMKGTYCICNIQDEQQ